MTWKQQAEAALRKINAALMNIDAVEDEEAYDALCAASDMVRALARELPET